MVHSNILNFLYILILIYGVQAFAAPNQKREVAFDTGTEPTQVLDKEEPCDNTTENCTETRFFFGGVPSVESSHHQQSSQQQSSSSYYKQVGGGYPYGGGGFPVGIYPGGGYPGGSLPGAYPVPYGGKQASASASAQASAFR